MEKSIYSADHKTFLELLIETRVHAGVTQIELAKKLDVAQSTISKFECGDRRLDLIQLRTVCKHLGLSLVEFVSEYERRVESRRRRKRKR